jgi:hypothetical protein
MTIADRRVAIQLVNVHPGRTRTPNISSEMLQPLALYALATVEIVTKHIWLETQMDDEHLRKSIREGIPNMHTGMGLLECVRAKIRRLQGEPM